MRLLKKLKLSILFILPVTLCDLCVLGDNFTQANAVTFKEANNPEIFLKQINGDKQCTLVAATMLLRRTAMMAGHMDWADITVDRVKEQAWIDGVGLKYTFTYADITVTKAAFGADPVNEAISLLNMHPEGLAIYDPVHSPRAHAVFLTDYTDGMFYCADPSDAVGSGRIPDSAALVQVQDAKSYWYVSSPSIAPSFPSAVEINDALQPTDIGMYDASLSQKSFIYDGTEKKPVVTIPGLTENTDFMVSYYNNTEIGTATAIITGTGRYTGSLMESFDVTAAVVIDELNKIQVALTKQTIKKGKTAEVKIILPDTLELVKEYSVNPSSLHNEVKFSYSSENKKTAVINSSGKITGIGKGSAKIIINAVSADGTKKTFALKIKVN